MGKASIRRGLFRLAARDNLGALIWLSKQHLGFAEKLESKEDPNDKTKTDEIKKLKDQLMAIKAIPDVV